MKIAYFDCFSGISGDMTIAAFLDAGLEMKALSRGLAELKTKGYSLKVRSVKRGSLAGTKFDCLTNELPNTHRPVREIIRLIERSGLNARVKATAKEIYTNIAKAEAKVHGIGSYGDARPHELGNIDSIVDVVGTAIAVDEMGIDEIYSSPVTMGRTLGVCEHGVLPIPGPASLELLKGVPIKISDIEAELVTPTGAGILRTLVKGYGEMPSMKAQAIGYGAGSKDLKDVPNMLRVIIGVAEGSFVSGGSFNQDKIAVIETDIDDMNPQNFEYLFERLFNEGALDVYTTAIQMKKSRPAFKLTVLAKTNKLKDISAVIFRETTAIGVRFHEAARFKLDRKIVDVKTRYGNVRVKLSGGQGSIFTASPEYEDCVKLAREKHVPMKLIYDEAKKQTKA